MYSEKEWRVALSTFQVVIEQSRLDVPNIRDVVDAAHIRWIKK